MTYEVVIDLPRHPGVVRSGGSISHYCCGSCLIVCFTLMNEWERWKERARLFLFVCWLESCGKS